MSSSIMERIAGGTVLGAEGYVFELERRGYIKAGPFVPEVVLDFPDAVAELHQGRQDLAGLRARDGPGEDESDVRGGHCQ